MYPIEHLSQSHIRTMKDDDDWQDAAFNTRHLHNRNDRGGQGGNSRHEFQPSNTFGSHLVKCVAMDKLQLSAPEANASGSKAKKRRGSRGEVVLEVYRLTDDEDGLLGSLVCAGVLEASVVFAGSRKLLWKIWQQLGGTGAGEASVELDPTDSKGKAKAKEQVDNTDGKKALGDDESDHEEESSDVDHLQSQSSSLDSEERQRRRVSTFEKNSFRHPKFWFRWQGEMADDKTGTLKTDGARVHGSGYIVFSSNDCKRFQGTITSEQLGWNNVKMSGWKARPQPERDFERDFEVQWGES
ncbi:hypothetical protein VMCG_10624 [Cytospora schulzeri]|uniref:YTH domain-containing protein n=1 Tax=Cytospora schulzeri TaxID=448051 RepID=A0A423V9S2_9PEZI|nr:hypothetical protein VMCG_10624 [Valsa malicola]